MGAHTMAAMGAHTMAAREAKGACPCGALLAGAALGPRLSLCARARAENMRREGFELSVSPPRVVYRTEGGQRLEPLEEVISEVDDDQAGAVIEARAPCASRPVHTCRAGLGTDERSGSPWNDNVHTAEAAVCTGHLHSCCRPATLCPAPLLGTALLLMGQ